MWQREDEARLVGLWQRPEEVGLQGVAHHEEACEVVLVVLYRVLQYAHAVHLGCLAAADGCPSSAVLLLDILCRACGVLSLHHLQFGVVGEVVAALHQRHGVRVHLVHRSPVVLGQTADAVAYVQFMLSHDRRSRLLQQFVVVQQAPRDGVLYRHHAYGGGVALDVLEHLLECGAADELYLLSLEILMGGDIVEGAQQSLYCYSFHIIKNPASIILKRDLNVYFFSFVFLKLKSTRNFPLHSSLQSKSRSNRKMRKTCSFLYVLINSGAKVKQIRETSKHFDTFFHRKMKFCQIGTVSYFLIYTCAKVVHAP